MRYHTVIQVAALCGALATPAAAGTFFRLEVGLPIAAGSAVKDKKTLFVVRPRLCDDEASVRISGTAEGIVNGARRRVPLRIVPLSTPGVHAVQRPWDDQGQWVVHLTGLCPATRAVTTAIVPIVGSTFDRNTIQLFPQLATREQVDAAVVEVSRVRK